MTKQPPRNEEEACRHLMLQYACLTPRVEEPIERDYCWEELHDDEDEDDYEDDYEDCRHYGVADILNQGIGE